MEKQHLAHQNKPDFDWEQSVRFQTKYQQRNPISRFLTQRFLRRIVDLTKDLCPEGGSLLDVGCGEGINLYHISEATDNFQLTGLEISQESLDVAKTMVPMSHLEQGSIYDLPYEDNYFDLVLCTEVLEHLEEPEKGLKEVCRVAKRDVILSVPHEPLWRMLNMARGAYWKDFGNTEGHLNQWSKRGFHAFVRDRFEELEDISRLPWTIVTARKSVESD